MKHSGRFSNESGQALVMMALGLSILLAFSGLAIDSALLFRAKRNLQTAADAAAQAGALDYLYNNSADSASKTGKAMSTANGYTDGSGGVVVSINTPPTLGPNAGQTGFIEAIVSSPVPMTLMSMFGFSTMTVKARAVAGTPTAGSACIWVMAPSGPSMNLQGSYDVEAPGCGIYVNSPGNDAFSTTGNGGTVNAKYLDVVGNSPPAHQTSPTAATINTAPRSSPWGDITGPTDSNSCTIDGTAGTIDSSTTSITGNYTGPAPGSAICFTKAVTISNATLGSPPADPTKAYALPVFSFKNGVSFSGTVTVWGAIDNYGGTFSQGNAVLNMHAPTFGSLDGIAVMQPSINTTGTCNGGGTTVPCLQVQFGSSGQTLDGYIYAPASQVYLQDNGGGTTSTGIVAGTFYVKSSTVRITSYDQAHTSTTLNRVVTLVE